MSSLELWFIIIVMGFIAFGLRYGPMVLLERFKLPPLLEQALRYVPAATLAGLVLPAFLTQEGRLLTSLNYPPLWAGLVAFALAWRFQNVLLTLAGGMGTLWLLQWLF
ncbi:MAG: AzlD domain-containing protein [Meiothermus sp.]|nr:AzlD domain-containing protein [Meiothermus sp.]